MRLLYGSLDLTDYPYSVEFGMDVGAPQNVYETLALLLQDGEVELSTRASNRVMSFNVLVEGGDLAAVADAEAALVAESEKPLNTVTVDPEDFGPASVYETYRGQVALARDDNGEIARLRRYTVSVRALPFVRSVAEVVTPATGSGTMTVPPTITSTTVDDGTSTAGWSTVAPATLSSSGGAVVEAVNEVTSSPGGSPQTVTLEATRTGTVDVSTDKQIVVLWSWDATGTASARPETWSATDFEVQVNGTTYLTRLSGTTSPARASVTEAVFQVPASITSISTIRLVLHEQGLVRAGLTRTLSVHDISRNNANASVSTPRQLQRAIDVIGSARTQGKLAITHETSALGDVLVYCWPATGNSYSPALRQFRSGGGGVTTDTTLVSGAYENLVGATATFTVAASRVPQGLYQLVARLGGAATTATVTWTATTVINGVDTGPTLTGTRAVPITTAYQIVPLGPVQLPTREVSASSSTAQVRITLTATVSSGATARLDEAWFFNSTIGQLVQVSCGTAAPSSGGSSNRLWIEPADVATPRPTLKVGYLADGSDAAFPLGSLAWQFPEFKPPRVNVFTVTTNALDAAVALEHTPRWHTNAAR